MRRLFIFDYDDTLANHPMYNSVAFKLPVRILPPLGGLIKGASEVLDHIVSRGDRLHLLTMNVMMDEASKWEKMDHFGASRWFDRDNVTMVRRKTPETMIRICMGFRKDRCYMVGNSFKHDIGPALEAGINAIYIPRPKLKRIFGGKLPDNERLIVLKDIGEILDIYDEL